jgi:hypothetical protein
MDDMLRAGASAKVKSSADWSEYDSGAVLVWLCRAMAGWGIGQAESVECGGVLGVVLTREERPEAKSGARRWC